MKMKDSPMNMISRLALAGAVILFSAQTLAHHSFAIFDFDTQIPFEGTVEKLTFRNPHIAMTLKVVDEDGGEQLIEFIEGAPANMLVRDGLRPNMIAPGTHIKTLGSPLKEEPNQYFLRKIILEDGSEY